MKDVSFLSRWKVSVSEKSCAETLTPEFISAGKYKLATLNGVFSTIILLIICIILTSFNNVYVQHIIRSVYIVAQRLCAHRCVNSLHVAAGGGLPLLFAGYTKSILASTITLYARNACVVSVVAAVSRLDAAR